MEISLIKEEMMRLWKESFHDSDEYIRLVFDSYFTPEMIEYEERDGHIISALLGVPYRFGNDSDSINGIYLCGLSTNPEYQHKGIMSKLIERFAAKVDCEKFSFLFLIPANTGLMRYYHDRNFVNAFYRMPERYVSTHDFKHEFENLIRKENTGSRDIKNSYYDSLEVLVIPTSVDKIENRNDNINSDSGQNTLLEVRNKICISIQNQEGNREGMQLFHSSKDIRSAIDECIISEGKVYAAINVEGEVTAVAFTYEKDDGENIDIYYSLFKDIESKYRLLEAIKTENKNSGMVIWQYPVKAEASGLWQPFYGAALPEAPMAGAVGEAERGYVPSSHSQVYGMARILNLYEILKFQAKDRIDLKYSILVKEGKTPLFMEYRAEKGHVAQKDLTDILSEDEKRKVLMTDLDVAEILFRRPDTDPIVEEVMELPPLGGAIALMLD